MPPLDPQNCVQTACVDDATWVVTQPYPVSVCGVSFTVPAGFETDGASVPRVLWAAIPPFGRHFNAAVVHDFLYRESNPDRKLPKCICDEIFLALMVRDGVPLARRIAMYEAVDTLGHSSYTRGKVAAAQSFANEEEGVA